MAVTINKASAKSKAAPKKKGKSKSTKVSHLGELVDEYGVLLADLKRQQEKLAPLIKKVVGIKADILEGIEKSTKPDETKEVAGHEYTLSVGMKANSTLISNKEDAVVALEEVKEGLALELAKVNLGDLKAYLTPEQYAKLTTTKRTGARSVKVSVTY